MSLPVLIAGGGIGGLAAGVALKRAGLPVLVLEQAPEIREVGAGLMLHHNAMAALRHLGLAAEVAARGEIVRQVLLRDPRGRVLSRFDTERMEKLTLVLLRRELQAVLADAVGPESLRTGSRVVDLLPGAEGCAVRLEDGTILHGRAVIGADGLHSVVRDWLLGPREPRYSGYTSWRALAPADAMSADDAGGETMGRGRRFGYHRAAPGVVYWYATQNAPPGGHDADLGAVQELFRGWHDPIPALIAATPPSALFRTDIRDRPPQRHWGRGPITLLGDAAHAMTPNLGQGAGTSIEDGVVLAECLRRLPVEAALRRYEAIRQPRTRRFQTLSWRVGRLGQWQNPLACALRDLLYRLTPESAMAASLRPLLQFDPEGDLT